MSKTTELSAGVTRNCPVCGENAAQPYLQKAELRLVRCGRCSMIYANPVAEALASGSYYDQVGTEFYLSPAKLESDYAAVRFERELSLIRRHCPHGKVLDVGCSSGAFLFQLNLRFPGEYEILGTDVSGAPLDYAESRGVPVRRGNFLEQDFGEERFASITFWAVIEHLLEPRRFLEKACSLLAPDGLVFILVPNMNSLAIRLIGDRYRYIYPQHLNYFSGATLRTLVERRFVVRRMLTTHFNPIVIWQDWRRGGVDITNRERAELLKRTTSYKQNPFLAPIKVGYRLAELGLAVLGLADNLAAVLQRRD